MSKVVKSSYHHGNLREALMQGALSCIRDHGAEHLSLRALAREIGVSQAAPYRHFEDKVALLSALASDGFERLGQAMTEAFETSGQDAVKALREVGMTYVRFAVQNPEIYRLMFGMKASEFNTEEMETGDHKVGYCVLERVIDLGLNSQQYQPHDAADIALTAWSLVHGLSSLLIDGLIELDEKSISVRFDALSTILFSGVSH